MRSHGATGVLLLIIEELPTPFKCGACALITLPGAALAEHLDLS